MDRLLPTIDLPNEPFDPRSLQPGLTEAWLEIGFGGGEHLVAQAARRPDVLFIGAEPFVNGVASAVRHLDEAKLSNVRIHHGDARDLLPLLPDGCLARVFVLFPDPWPKTRQQKRRLLQPEVIASLARVLAPQGAFRFATDVMSYADQTLERVLASGLFDWPVERADDWRLAPTDHVATRYEVKKLGDCAPVWFDFRRHRLSTAGFPDPQQSAI